MAEWGLKTLRRGQGIVLGLLGAVGAGVFLIFQNCSAPAEPGTDNGLSKEAADIPFSYDASLDQIAYMSCSALGDGAFDQSTYFTLRAGAYRKGGIKILDKYVYDRAKQPKDRIIDLLSASPANTNTRLQLAIRSNANFQGILPAANGGIQENRDYANLFAELGSRDMSKNLIDLWVDGYLLGEEKRMRYIRDGTIAGRRIEGQLAYVNGYALADQVRNFITNDGFLGLTYTQIAAGSGGGSNQAGQALARSPADYDDTATLNSTKTVYGRGYKMTFAQPRHYQGGVMNSNFPAVALSTIQETSLDKSQLNDATPWLCPEKLQFRIVRIQDITDVAADCPVVADPQNPDQDLLKIARNSLRTEDWYINMAKRCIVPKRERLSSSNCYGSGSGTTTTTRIVYNLSQPCDYANTLNYCTHYSSVCYRQ